MIFVHNVKPLLIFAFYLTFTIDFVDSWGIHMLASDNNYIAEAFRRTGEIESGNRQVVMFFAACIIPQTRNNLMA